MSGNKVHAMQRLFLVVLAFGGAISAGCGRNGSPQEAADSSVSPAPHAAVRLTLLVVDDPELAEAAKLLRGEWAERSGGELVVEETSLDNLIAAEQFTADLIVYPSRQVGALVERDWLRPVRGSVLHDDEFAFDDLLPLVRNEVIRYGGQVWGVSLGEPPLVLAWQGEVEPVPATWERLDRQLPPNEKGDSLVVELIARAATYSDPRYRAELLFDPATMAPRLTSPVIVQALEEMVARSGRSDDGAHGSVITWPTAQEVQGDKPWHFAALPRSETVYDNLRQQWQRPLQEQTLTVLGFAGRSASVTASSRNATSAFKLLAWLTRGETASALSSRSRATVWFRSSQSLRAERWLAKAGGDVAAVVTRLLSSDNFFLLPRVPGIDRYLAELNGAAVQAVRGEAPPAEALESAAREWEKLTDSLGRQQQLAAYHRHLGLVESGG